MILLVQDYATGRESRDAEIVSCKNENKESSLFKAVATVDGSERRWTIGELFDICHEKFSGEICVVANSDIRFHESLRLAEACLREAPLLALTRWEREASPLMLGHYEDGRFYSGSQDAWVFVAGSIPSIEIEIPMGHVGCDNALVGWAVKNGVRVADPAIDIKSFHLHADESRPERPSVYGYYGYPELTTATLSPYVLCHRAEEEGFHHLCKFN